MFRKFLAWIIRTLIAIILTTLIFSSVLPSVEKIIPNVIGGVFTHASPDSQQDVVNKLSGICKEATGEKAPADMADIGAVCNEYNAGNMKGDRLFAGFVDVIMKTQFSLPDSQIIKKYNGLQDNINSRKPLLFGALLLLFVLLYLILMDFRLFVAALGSICFSIGWMIMLPYLIIILYDNLIGIDTTAIFSAMINGTGIEPGAIISVILLVFMSLYSPALILVGIILLGIGVAGFVYRFTARKKETSGKKEDKKAKKEDKEGSEEKTEDKKPDKKKSKKKKN